MKASMRLKKALCLLLAVGLLCAAVPVGAHAARSSNDIPRIGLPGIGAPLRINAGTPDEAEIGVVDTEALTGQILPILGDISAAVALCSWDKAADAFVKLAWALFAKMQVDVNGKSVYPISAAPCPDPYESDHFDFQYDWRLDPWESAGQLHAYIQEVKKATGQSQVALLAHSEGNLVVMAYFARYGYADIHDYIASMSAHNGLTMVGELFNRNIELNSGVALEFLRSFGNASGKGAMELMAPAADLLQTTGIAEWLIGMLATLLEHVQGRVFDEALVPLLVQWPALWGFVPHEYYESAKKSLLSDAKYSNFKKIIDNMHYKAGAGYKADTLIKDAVDAGVRVSIIAAYGFPTQPFAAHSDIDADGLIDTSRSSSGATTPGVFRTFPAGYQQKVKDGHNHLSPDGKIDASTCLLPEQTWFIRGQLHFTGNTGALRDAILATPGNPTIRSVKGYPQFLTAVADGVFEPNQPVPAASRPTLLGSTWRFNKALGKVIWESITG